MLMKGKGKAIAQLNDSKWTCEFVFVADVTTHFNELKTLLQTKGRLISSMINSFKAFDIKVCLGISVKKVVHFPTVLNWYRLGVHAEE